MSTSRSEDKSYNTVCVSRWCAITRLHNDQSLPRQPHTICNTRVQSEAVRMLVKFVHKRLFLLAYSTISKGSLNVVFFLLLDECNSQLFHSSKNEKKKMFINEPLLFLKRMVNRNHLHREQYQTKSGGAREERERQRQRDRQTDRQRQRQTETDRQTDRDREREGGVYKGLACREHAK